MPGFALVNATLIGWYKPLLRPLMVRSIRPRGLELMSWYLSPWCLVGCLIPSSLMLRCRYSAIMSLSWYFFLGFGLLCFQEGALRLYMPTETAVMENRRSSDGMRLLGAWNIIIDLFLLFFFNNWRKLWTVGGTNTVFEEEGTSEEEATYPRPVLSCGLFWMDSIRVSFSSVTLSSWSCVSSSFSSSSCILSSNELFSVCRLFKSLTYCFQPSLSFSNSL
jgi:hypothetical protein